MKIATFAFNQYPIPLLAALSTNAVSLDQERDSVLYLMEVASSIESKFVTTPHWIPANFRKHSALGKILGLLESKKEATMNIVHHKIPLKSGLKAFTTKELTNLQTLEDLMKVTYSGLPAGRAIANYLARTKRTSEFEVTSLRYTIGQLYRGYVSLADFLLELIGKGEVSQVNIYQGNFLYDACLLHVAEQTRTPFHIYSEVNSSYFQKTPFSFHDYSSWVSNFESKLDLQIQEVKTGTNEQTYLTNLQDFSRRHFLHNQEVKYVRSSLRTKNLITYFTSNAKDERFGLSDEWGSELSNQILTAQFIAQEISKWGRILVVRVHPNTLTKAKVERNSWQKLSNIEGIELVQAQDRDDSYEILDRSSLVIAPGSTIGLEASARGIPSITTMPAIYDGFNPTYQVRTFKELELQLNLFLSDQMKRIDPARALGWMRTREEMFFYPNTTISETLGKSWNQLENELQVTGVLLFINRANKLFNKLKLMIGDYFFSLRS